MGREKDGVEGAMEDVGLAVTGDRRKDGDEDEIEDEGSTVNEEGRMDDEREGGRRSSSEL